MCKTNYETPESEEIKVLTEENFMGTVVGPPPVEPNDIDDYSNS